MNNNNNSINQFFNVFLYNCKLQTNFEQKQIGLKNNLLFTVGQFTHKNIEYLTKIKFIFINAYTFQ